MVTYKGCPSPKATEAQSPFHVIVTMARSVQHVRLDAERTAKFQRCYVGMGRSRQVDDDTLATFCFATIEGAQAFARHVVNFGLPCIVTKARSCA